MSLRLTNDMATNLKAISRLKQQSNAQVIRNLLESETSTPADPPLDMPEAARTGVLFHVAKSPLLPEEMRDQILTGVIPSRKEIAVLLTTRVLDCEAVIAGDAASTLNEKRLARMLLAAAFLVALEMDERD